MEFRPNKCQVIHIINTRKRIYQIYNICGHVLEKVKLVKYLRLNWNTHIDHVVKKAELFCREISIHVLERPKIYATKL